MIDLFKGELLRFRLWAIVAFVANLVVLGFLSRMVDMAQQPIFVYQIFAAVYARAGALLGLSDNGAVILIVIMLILLIAGMFMDAVTVMFISLPIFMPVVRELGWDPVWFGVLLMVNLAIGLITPPVGINLYVAANVTRLSIERVARGALPFLLASLVGLVVVAVFPQMSLFLVRLMGP